MSDNKALIERLREYGTPGGAMCMAADEIERLIERNAVIKKEGFDMGFKTTSEDLREIERLNDANQRKSLAVVLAQEWIAEKDAEIARLKEKLSHTVDLDPDVIEALWSGNGR